MEGIGSGVLGEIPFLLNRIMISNCFHRRDAKDAKMFILILCR
jgi:hypothetical protein